MNSATPVTDTQARKALTHVRIQAYTQWRQDGQRCDLSEYQDAGVTALVGCMVRYTPTRGASFSTYAEYRVNGAVRDAPQAYTTWHQGGKGLPHADHLRPPRDRQGDPLLHKWFLRQVATLSPCSGRLLRQLLAGEALGDIANEEGVAYTTVAQRYHVLKKTLRKVWERV